MDRVIEQKKGIKKKHLPFIAGATVFMVFVIWFIFFYNGRAMHVKAEYITVVSVEQGLFNDYIRLSGQVQPKRSVLLTSSESGIVMQTLVNEGAFVNEGDVLVVLNNPNLVKETTDIEAQYKEKENNNRDAAIALEKEKLSMQQQHLSAKIEANRSKRTYEQQQALYADGLTTREEFLRAKENYELAESNLNLLVKRLYQDSLYQEVQHVKMLQSTRNMYNNLELARKRIDDLNVKATHSGQLGSFSIQLGQNISAGSVVGIINVLGDYKVQVNIDERYIDRISAGLQATFERNDKYYDMVASTIYPDVKNGLFRADFTFVDDIPENIRVGQTYFLELELGEAVNRVLLPRGSYFSSTGGKWIYVLSSDGSKAVRREIKIGRQNPDYYELLEGVEPGEKVIISSYDHFGDREQLIIE